MVTGQSIVEATLRKLQALGTGESLGTTQQTQALAEVNRMFDRWNAERLSVYSVSRNTATLTAGTNPHTIAATGANLAIARPSKIDYASIVRSGEEIPIPYILTVSEWQAISDKVASGPVPSKLFYRPSFPTGNIYLWPVPSEANTLVLYTWDKLAAIADWATTPYTFPEGYEDAIIYNLAIRLAPEYGRNPSDVIVELARESLAVIRSLNIPTSYLGCDLAMLNASEFYDIRTGY